MNPNNRSYLAFSFLLLCCFVPSYLHPAQSVPKVFEAPIQFFLIEKNGKDGKITFSRTRSIFLKQLKLSGFRVLDDLEPPLISKSMVRYGNVRGTGPSGIGYVHLLLTDDDKVHYLSDAGSEVGLKSDPQKVTWIFETKKAWDMADKAGAKYALVVEVTSQMAYQDNSSKPVYRVALKADLYQADDGKSVFHHEQSMVKLADSDTVAILGACQFLAPQLVDQLGSFHSVKVGQ